MEKAKESQPGAPLNIYQRINAVMGECDYVQREKKDGMKYTVTSHDKVTGLVRPLLQKHGVVYYPHSVRRSQDGDRTEIDMIVRFVNIDDKADFIDVETCGYGVDPQDKGPGKAMSYSVKYALLKLLGLETGDDPDNESLDHKPRDQAKIDEAFVAQAEAWMRAQTVAGPLHREWSNNLEQFNALPQPLKERMQIARDEALAAILAATAKPQAAGSTNSSEIDWKIVGDEIKTEIDEALDSGTIKDILEGARFAEFAKAVKPETSRWLLDRAQKRTSFIMSGGKGRAA